MKKVIAILVAMIVLVGAVFALTNDNLKITSTVGMIKPNFVLYAATGTVTNGEIATGLDISEQDITWTFGLKQLGSVKVIDNTSTTVNYSRYKGTLSLTVTIGKFTTPSTSAIQGTQSTDAEITSSVKGTDVEDKLNTVAGVIATNKMSVEFKPVYLGAQMYDTEAAKIGEFTAKWTHDPSLPTDGTTVYKADITLTYSID